MTFFALEAGQFISNNIITTKYDFDIQSNFLQVAVKMCLQICLQDKTKAGLEKYNTTQEACDVDEQNLILKHSKC